MARGFRDVLAGRHLGGVNNPHGESTGGCALLRRNPLSPQALLGSMLN